MTVPNVPLPFITGAIYGFCMGLFFEYIVLLSLHLPMRSIIVACSVCSIAWAICGAIWGMTYNKKVLNNNNLTDEPEEKDE